MLSEGSHWQAARYVTLGVDPTSLAQTPSVASFGMGPPQPGKALLSISWIVLTSALRLPPPMPTEAEMVLSMRAISTLELTDPTRPRHALGHA